jgi:hypothetical protein
LVSSFNNFHFCLLLTLIEIFPFSFLALLFACIAIYESGLIFNNNSSPMLRLLLPRVPYMDFSLTNIIIVIKYALSLTVYHHLSPIFLSFFYIHIFLYSCDSNIILNLLVHWSLRIYECYSCI